MLFTEFHSTSISGLVVKYVAVIDMTGLDARLMYLHNKYANSISRIDSREELRVVTEYHKFLSMSSLVKSPQLRYSLAG